MCYPIGARLAQRRILALDTLYHHLFSTPGRDAPTTNQLNHDLVLWLTHHSFEELPDALEYYLANPNSDLEENLAHLTCLDPWGVQVHIHPVVTIYMNTLLAWAKCFLATYGVYFTAPPSPSPPPDRLYVCRTNRPSFSTSVCRATSLSIILTAPTVCLSPRKSVALSVHPPDSPSVIPARPSHEPSVHPPVTPSLTRPSAPPTRQSCATSVRPSVTVRPSVHHPTTSVWLSYITPSARHTNPSVRPSANVPTSVRHHHPFVRPPATVRPSVRHPNQSVSLSVTS